MKNKLIRKIITLIMIVMISLQISSCNSLTTIETNDITAHNQQDIVNKQLNFLNLGYVVQDGEWIYFSSIYDKYEVIKEGELYVYDIGKIYKSHIDGTNLTEITDDAAIYINVIDDWVYYVNLYDWTIYRVKTDGSNREQIMSNGVYSVYIDDGWIFYGNRNDGNRLYKSRLDGSENTRLNDWDTGYLCVVGDWVYFSVWDDFSVKRIRKDGTNEEEVAGPYIGTFCIDENYLIYAGANLVRINLDNGENEILLEEYARTFNIAGDWIYYTSSDYELYRIKKDGTRKKKLAGGDQVKISNVCLIGDWIYYVDGNGLLYKVRTDGSQNQIVVKDK